MLVGLFTRIALFAAVYLACAGVSSAAEVAAAAIVAAVAAGLAHALGWSGRPYAAQARDFLPRAPAVAASILHDAAWLTVAFARLAFGGNAVRGTTIARPFELGARSPEARARRSLVIAAVALAPNTVPLAIAYEDSALLVHRLLPGLEPKDRRWPL